MGANECRVHYRAYVAETDTTPDYTKTPTFDPLYGFPNGRKKREMKATMVEMESAHVPHNQRDYCAHELLKYLECYNTTFPFTMARCAKVKHHYLSCEHEDWILRMKEFERERRLKNREKRKREGFVSEELVA